MSMVARRLGIAFGSFVIAWLLVTVVARWLFGSGNVLVWVLAAMVGAGVYLALMWRDRRLRLDARENPRSHDIAPR
jgi:Flp pilus assembly protein TadB